MSNRLEFYRDNILSKIKRNEELEGIIQFIKDDWFNEEKSVTIQIKNHICKKSIKVESGIIIKVLEQLIEYNDERIDQYLSLSFKDKKEEK